MSIPVDTRPDCQDNARELDRAPRRELGWSFEYVSAHLDQLRPQHGLREPAQRHDRNLTAVRYPMQQRGGSPMDVIHRHNAPFILVTVTEIGALVALADLFWPQAMWNVSERKRCDRALAPQSSASANSTILACVAISDS